MQTSGARGDPDAAVESEARQLRADRKTGAHRAHRIVGMGIVGHAEAHREHEALVVEQQRPARPRVGTQGDMQRGDHRLVAGEGVGRAIIEAVDSHEQRADRAASAESTQRSLRPRSPERASAHE